MLKGAGDLALEVGLVANGGLEPGGVGGSIALLAGFGTASKRSTLDVFLEGELEAPVADGDGLDAEGLEVAEGLTNSRRYECLTMSCRGSNTVSTIRLIVFNA